MAKHANISQISDPGGTLDQLIHNSLGSELFPGIEILVANRGQVLLHKCWGHMAGPGSAPLRTGTLFDLASLSKPMATATLLLGFAEQGILSLDDPVIRYFPGFQSGERDQITLRHLASHMSGLPAHKRLMDQFTDPDLAFEHLLQLPLEYAPGRGVTYSCMGYIILGKVLEHVGGDTLATLFQQQIAGPYGLQDSLYCPAASGYNTDHIAPCKPDAPPGIVHDSNSRLFDGQAGNAGLFSTAPDLHRFANIMLGNPPMPGLWPALHRQTPTGHPPHSIGWELSHQDRGVPSASCGTDFPNGAIGHTGFSGTSLWLDPMSGLIVIALSNRVYLSHSKTREQMIEFRNMLHSLISRQI